MVTGLKHEKISVKWKFFVYFIVFGVILLIILAVMQTVYLDSFYKKIKKKELDKAQKKLMSVIDGKNLKHKAEKISGDYDVCIVIMDMDYNEIYSFGIKDGSAVKSLNKYDLRDMYSKALDNGKSRDFNLGENNSDECLVRMNIVKSKNYGELIVLMETEIIPVNATVDTIRIQLIYISAFMVVLSLILALIFSKNISHSIISVSTSAKELIKGNYNVEFEGRDYKEVAELSDVLNKAAIELSRADMLQNELIANVSHDLRTPLTMISGYAEVMRDIPGENTPENVQVIIDETNRLTLLVNDLLDISKINAGVSELKTKVYDLTDSIKSTVERNAKLVEPYGYKIMFHYKYHVFVDADEFKIYQVIYNIIGNAINYSGKKKQIFIRQKVSDKKVRIEVEDTGPGIPEEELDYVWERYYKVGRDRKRTVVGTGLGLSIARNILEMHNAEYGVESEMDKGSIFWFQLDIVDKIV